MARALPDQTLADGARACIIGAGCTGITAAKAFREAGVPYDCFEKGTGLGGNWRYDNDNGMSSAYRSLHIITSKEHMRFSDFPMPESFPTYGHHSDVLRYFQAYADHFGVTETLTFGTAVTHVAAAGEGQWDVTLDTGETRRYGAVLVCNGHHWSPRMPSFPGQFDGESLHSHHYRVPEPLLDKRVLIVGIGNSACDIAVELCRVASCVHLSTRRSAWIFPKYIMGIPTDQWSGPWVERVPLPLRRLFYRNMARLTVGDQARYGIPHPRHDVLQEHPTINQDLAACVDHGRITLRPNIAHLAGDDVRFVDGTTTSFDAIIYATGYDIRFPFFDAATFQAKDNVVRLFMNVVEPTLPNIYFMGLVQPLGAIMPLAESQARWVADLLTDRARLPDAGTMFRRIARDQATLTRRYVRAARHTIQVDFWAYKQAVEREHARGVARRRGRVPLPERLSGLL